ncbi:MAG: class I mannose-6-phosphate isomerase, partial [Bacteroidota bacterium]
MWYIVDADDDASLIVGFNKSITAQEYQRHVDNDTLLEVLNRESVKKDDVLYIPAGRIHTIGKGLLIAEIQQSSDVTYRIHDFNRVDSDGKTRELHNDLALDAIDFSLPESYLTSYDVHASECIIGRSDYFITKRILLNEPTKLRFTSESCTVLMCVDGDLNVNGIPELRNITRGETILIPASQKELSMVPTMNSTLLEVTIPNLSE